LNADASKVLSGNSIKVQSNSQDIITVVGTCTYDADTSDATASAAIDVMVGKTAYSKGSKIIGTATSDATAAANNIVSGYTAYVNGQKITGSITVYSDLS